MNSKRTFLAGLVGAGAAMALGRQTLAQQATTYTYDVHGRLIGVNRSGAQTSYTYDAANNRTGRGSGAPPPPPPPPPLSASLYPTTWYGSPSYPDPPVVATASGGVAPYTYQWRRVSGSNRVYLMNVNGNSTSFSGAPEEYYGFTAQFVCKVTDALGSQVDTNSVSATFGPD